MKPVSAVLKAKCYEKAMDSIPTKKSHLEIVYNFFIHFASAEHQLLDFSHPSAKGVVGSCISQGFSPTASFHFTHAHFSLMSNQKDYDT